jgi:hypothetical protein
MACSIYKTDEFKIEARQLLTMHSCYSYQTAPDKKSELKNSDASPQNLESSILIPDPRNSVQTRVPSTQDYHSPDYSDFQSDPKIKKSFVQENMVHSDVSIVVNTEEYIDNQKVDVQFFQQDVPKECAPKENNPPVSNNPPVDNRPPVNKSMPGNQIIPLEVSLNSYFLKNELLPNIHPLARKLVKLNLEPKVKEGYQEADFVVLKTKRCDEQFKKVQLKITKMIVLYNDFKACNQAYGLAPNTAERLFPKKLNEADFFGEIIQHGALFWAIFNAKFFEELYEGLKGDIEKDIQTNILSKLPNKDPDFEAQNEFMKSVVDQKDPSRYSRYFKKPFLLQEIICSIINYLKSFIYAIKKLDDIESEDDNGKASRMLVKTPTEKFLMLLNLKRIYEEKLMHEGLIKKPEAYPPTKQRNSKGHKNLDCQTFLKKRVSIPADFWDIEIISQERPEGLQQQRTLAPRRSRPHA